MKFIAFLILLTFLFSCSDDKKTKLEGNSQASTISSKSINDNKFMVFSVPSPTMIAASFKLLELSFDENLVYSSNNAKPEFTLSRDKAVNLGISLVDLGYSALYNQNQYIIKAIAKVRTFTEDLNIENQKIIDMTLRFEENLNNQDSLMTLLHNVQSGIDKYYLGEEQHELALLVLYGMYIEGLFFTTEAYNNLNNTKNWQKYSDVLGQLLFQQKIHLLGLLDLMEIYNSDEKYEGILNAMIEIRDIFESMSFAYSMDEDSKHIQKVNFRRNHLPLLQKKVTLVRQNILTA